MTRPGLTEADLALAAAAAAQRDGDAARALAAFERARAAGASPKLTAQGHALALSELGRAEEAVAVYRPWFERNRKDVAVWNLMGVLLKRAGRLTKSAEVLEKARRMRPSDISPWHNLGNVLAQMGDHARAAETYRGALRIAPKSAELWRLLGAEELALQRWNEAERSLRTALRITPSDRRALALLVQALHGAGRPAELDDTLETALAAAPGDDALTVTVARHASRRGNRARALALLERVIARNRTHVDANFLLAHILGDGDRRGANAALARATEGDPTSFELLDRRIDSLVRSRYDDETAHIEQAYTLSCEMMARFPDRLPPAARTLRTVLMRVMDEDRMAATGDLSDLLPHWLAEGRHSSVHYELGQVTTLEDRIALVDWHRDWGRKVEAAITPLPPVTPALHGARKLRVGFMSSDLRHHPVTYFALPLLEGYDPDAVEVFCYSFSEKPADKVQTHLASKVTAFRHWPGRPTPQVAEGIAADGLDILFELGGSTAMNKLEVMAYRPARLGASWLGYPHSAGLSRIDLILTDPWLHPADPRLLIERPFAMPETWVALSRMFAPTPITDATPEARKGHLTFGTANNPYKYTPFCLDLWAMVLRAVPGSRFVFLRPEAGAPSFVANTRTAFARRDVDPDRLDYIGVRGDHMRHYNEIDIALDTAPHVGGTTTCEALWMGVPTITLVGPGFPERLSYSNLTNAGLGDLAASTPEDYVAAAADLAADPARRLQLRHGLRAQIAANPLGQPDRFARHFYGLARKVASE
ncbi:tetratricopeptide repeat protein [Roseicyclus mahoneyensis]|uniref:protein O-GlcNAc transferase n=1 Tax=Roseicyclus mahoneyensis TaxID=164332 RepID=A0A316GHZ1_9RHOB|nr:tetratricopeptide repeat protein [Roseicyclus mahoneyensis]PWK59608.1 tetratricopeptide repeat protein [Roseicyclus mahoneyensis]